ncbi:MAG TPA: hypothetical protein VNL39_12815 [Xanthobacteraceae bacterium]|nr:hypothetical protein [Xanthobacteraceae bacterium]
MIVAALGVPVNDLLRYTLLVLAAVMIFAGVISRRPGRWAAALSVVGLVTLGQSYFAAPRIEEGHNVYLGREGSAALAKALPAQVLDVMAAEFDARYPPDRRCDRTAPGCWRGLGFPDRAFAFSADGIFQRPIYSRRVTGISSPDPVWQRLGFVNEVRYNWYGVSDLIRYTRERRFWTLHPWRLSMPYFVLYQFSSDFSGSRLCWQGTVLWEEAEQVFALLRHETMACRPLGSTDVGRRIIGLAIAEPPLSIQLKPAMALLLRGLWEPALALIGIGAVLILLVRVRPRRLVLPFALLALSVIVVVLHDATFIGGVRPFDGGDDGLAYDGWSRAILQHLLAGDVMRALEGEEKVFYFTPGLRYLRAVEHMIFGETYLGYLSLMLTLPFLVFAAFRRFLTARIALAITLIFIAVPVGALFGSTFYLYVKWAARGFADPAAGAFFLAGLVVLVGRMPPGPDARFAPAFAAGLLFALALFVRPNLAPGAAVLLGGAGLAALWQGELRRLAGLCIGFVPVLSMALHNWYFGGAFVLFSMNATIPEVMPMPPSAYVAALAELWRWDFSGGMLARAGLQIARWLTGPTESLVMVPVHAAALVVLGRVAVSSRHEPWLRLTALATLAQHSIGLFFLYAPRYHHLTWLLTLLAAAAWMREEGYAFLRRTCPVLLMSIERHPLAARLERAFEWCAQCGGLPPRSASPTVITQA